MRFSNSLAIAQSGTNIILENISSEVFLVDHSSCQDYLLDALAQCSDSVFVRILVPGRVRRVSFLLVWREVDGSPFSRYWCPCQGLGGLSGLRSGVDLCSDFWHHLHFFLQWWHFNFSVAPVFRVIHAQSALFIAAISSQCPALGICRSILVSVQFQGLCCCVFTTH